MAIVDAHSSLLLAIETSCDETAVAILDGPTRCLASCVWSQAASHAPFGGVVPEFASRQHGEILPGLVRSTLAEARIVPEQLSAVAATTGPGLPTALMVGAAFAKGLAAGLHKPFLGIDHLEGHLLSPFFCAPAIPPHLGLVVSGGHTLLIDVRGLDNYRMLGTTLDDAAGEAFDKVAQLLGLGYPGGIEIDKLARSGDPTRIEFPRSMLNSQDFNFSFSGLKTAVRIFLEKAHNVPLPDVCASFQQAVIDVLIGKTLRAAKACGHTLIAVSGGVSSNSLLQETLAKTSADAGIAVRFAPRDLRTDNAAMIGYAAALRHARGDTSDLSTPVTSISMLLNAAP